MILMFVFLGLIIAVVLIILITRLNVTIHIVRRNQHHVLQLKVTAWFDLIKYEKEWQLIQLFLSRMDEVQEQVEDEVKALAYFHNYWKTMWAQLQQVRKQFRKANKIVKRFGRHVYLTQWVWRSHIGTGMADETGVLAGVVWGVKSGLIRLLYSYFTVKTRPELSVQPAFQAQTLQTELKCTIQFRIGYAILAGIRMTFILKNDNGYLGTL